MKRSKKILIISEVIFFVLLGAFVIDLVISFMMYPGRDHYHYIGDDKQYQLLSLNGLALRDEVNNKGLASHIYRYVDNDPYLYFIREPSSRSGITQDGITYYYDYDLDSGERIMYESLEDIPVYMILNYETAELAAYVNWEDIPEADQAIFNEPVTEECLQDKTCYDAR